MLQDRELYNYPTIRLVREIKHGSRFAYVDPRPIDEVEGHLYGMHSISIVCDDCGVEKEILHAFTAQDARQEKNPTDDELLDLADAHPYFRYWFLGKDSGPAQNHPALFTIKTRPRTTHRENTHYCPACAARRGLTRRDLPDVGRELYRLQELGYAA